ncbi:unnamed protein product [Microthlaspi erraticum]|uniref:Peptidase A1 domain-containing protein n=1 Tax=Microthlaspi erraticum TaxID=1685480 RepID=A0A6D2JDH1_9BRAS|nr:unnamed protein product [Microthlaspi erraticum]CAA7041390.1 unnamed protein product [Microthlaspi erraticum]
MIMALSLRIIITCFLLITATASSSPPPGAGFTIELIQRRSNSSSSRLGDDGSSPYADTIFETMSYLMKLQIGTPPVEFEVELDTGSNLIWTQCLPCVNCFKQDSPIFDPSKSSSYKPKICHDGPDHSCPYAITYMDDSYSMGTLATETVSLQSTSGQPFVMTETIIGCGHNNSGFLPTGSGMVGLGWGASSLISQMGERFLCLLSYCFSGKGTSKLNFGSNAIVAGDGTVAANMFIKTEKQGLYYLNLEAVSVGDNRIETLGTPFHALEGNMVIDSGTTFTYLPGSYWELVKEAVDSAVITDRVDFMGDKLCYNSDSIDIFPVITMHFSGGADLVLDKYNTYLSDGGMYCLAILCADPTDVEGTFGNRAQNNFLVGYDPSSLLVSFKPTDCSALWN